VISGGILLIGLGDLLGFVLVRSWGSWQAMLPAFLVVGLWVGLAAPLLSSTGTAAVPAQRGGMAGGAINTARQIGFAFGIALLGSVFTAGAQHTLEGRHLESAGSVAHDVAGARSADLLRALPAGARDLLGEAIHAAAANGMTALLAVAGLVGAVGAVLSFAMLRERPTRETAGETRPEPALTE
jgi:hypothetical protein